MTESFNIYYLFPLLLMLNMFGFYLNWQEKEKFDWIQFCGLNGLRQKLLLPNGQTALSRLGWIIYKMGIIFNPQIKAKCVSSLFV